ncbi:MAG: polysaccharide biosynthesis/export family protein [Verrucomicrobia bacterium]|nr:polysaccharide biosynthesis/export family protein [Verrucomicrobiota bacterium]
MKKIILSLLSLLLIALPRLQAQNTFRNGDVLEMRLSGPPEEFTREFNIVLTVDEGTVNLPLIGRVAAAGMSSSALAASIERRLKEAKIFTVANVNINSNSGKDRIIIVGGSVRSPGKQPWIQDLTLTGAISGAGGPSEFAKDTMKIIRGGKAQSYSRKAIKKNPGTDPRVEPGDIIEQEGD